MLPRALADACAALYVARLQVDAVALDRIVFPTIPGYALHGALGYTLQPTFCSCGRWAKYQQACLELAAGDAPHKALRPPAPSDHDEACYFRQLFEPVGGPSLAAPLKLGQHLPPPYVIHPPLRRVFRPMDRISFELVLVGRAATGPPGTDPFDWGRRWTRALDLAMGLLDAHASRGHDPQTRAFNLALSMGAGFMRANQSSDIQGPAVLREVHDAQGLLVWAAHGTGTVRAPGLYQPWVAAAHDNAAAEPANTDGIAIHFLSPVHAQTPKDKTGRSRSLAKLSAHEACSLLASRVAQRLARLSALYCREADAILSSTAEPLPNTEYLAQAAGHAWMSPGHGLNEVSGSAKRRGLRPTLGSLAMKPHRSMSPSERANFADVVRLLRAGVDLGVGSRTTHGLGWYEILPD